MKVWIVALAAALVSVGALTVGAFDDETYDKETVMKSLFNKKSGKFSSVLKKQAEAKSPEWGEIQKTTDEIAKYGKALGKNDPDKGSKESWKKLTDKLATDTKQLDEAADAKDLAKLKASQKSIQTSCKSCHDAHREQ